MAARVRVAGVDGARQAPRRAIPGRPVAARAEALQERQVEDVGPADVDAVLPVLLRAVERAVGEPDQLFVRLRVRGEAGHARADREVPHLVEVEDAEALDDRGRGRQRVALAEPGQDDGELVAAQPECLAVLPQPRGDLGEDPVAGGVAETVVHVLEVVDVDEAEGQRPAALAGVLELLPEPVVEMAMVPEARKRIRQREPHRAQRSVGRALVERDREQRPCKREREHRRALPEHDEHQRCRSHQREGEDRRAHVRDQERPERLSRASRDDGCDQRRVHDVLRHGAETDLDDDGTDAVPADRRDQQAAAPGREAVDGGVVGDADAGPVLEQLSDRRRCHHDDHPRGPAEEDDRRDAEDEGERDAGHVEPVERDREAIREHHPREERAEATEGRGGVGRVGEGDRGGHERRGAGNADRCDDERKSR